MTLHTKPPSIRTLPEKGKGILKTEPTEIVAPLASKLVIILNFVPSPFSMIDFVLNSCRVGSKVSKHRIGDPVWGDHRSPYGRFHEP